MQQTHAASRAMIGFGAASQDWTHLGAGWRQPQNGFRASQGASCEFWLENPGASTDWVLELDLEGGNPPHRIQRLTVLVRGEIVGRCVIARRRVAAFAVPARLLAVPGPVRLDFHHVPGEKPNDWDRPDPKAPALIFRRLEMLPAPLARRTTEPLGTLAVEALADAAGMPADRFMCQFESLGENCEFGLVQRRCGAEPLGLFRFGAPKLPELIECLRERLAYVGDDATLSLKLLTAGNPPEYMVVDARNGMSFHSFRFQGEADEEQLLRQQGPRLRRLAQKFLEDAAEGRKIMVWRPSNSWTSKPQAIALHDALCTLGPVRLLWIEASDAENPPGTLVEIRPGLLRGHIHGFCGLGMVHTANPERWIGLCVAAHRHVAGQGSPAGLDPGTVSPRPIQATATPAPATLTMVAHIAHLGDVASGPDGWVGEPGSGRAVEGLMIEDLDWPPLAALRVQVLQQDQSFSLPSAPGDYCGTRGKSQPVLGFLLSAPDDLLDTHEFVAEASFVDGSRVDACCAGTLCASEGRKALEALRIAVRPRG